MQQQIASMITTLTIFECFLIFILCFFTDCIFIPISATLTSPGPTPTDVAAAAATATVMVGQIIANAWTLEQEG